MYASLATKLAVTNGVDQFSPAVSMAGANAARAGITMINFAGTTLTVTMQATNDLQNWRDLSTTQAVTANGFTSFANTAITDAYIRLKYSLSGAGTLIMAADINTSQQ